MFLCSHKHPDFNSHFQTLTVQHNKMTGNRKERERYSAQFSFSSDQFCLQLYPNLLATHLIQFCTSDGRKTPPLPTYGTSDMPDKSGFCAVNSNCLTGERAYGQTKLMLLVLTAALCNTRRLNPHYLFSFWTNKSQCSQIQQNTDVNQAAEQRVNLCCQL